MTEMTADEQLVIENEKVSPGELTIGIKGITYQDLYKPERLRELTEIFYAQVATADSDLYTKFTAYRDAMGVGYADKTESDLIVRMAPHLSSFIAQLFGIEAERNELSATTLGQSDVFEFKKNFVQRRAFKKYANTDVSTWDFAKLDAAVSHLQQTVFGNTIGMDDELATARMVTTLMGLEKQYDLFFGPKQQPLPESTRRMAADLVAATAGN